MMQPRSGVSARTGNPWMMQDYVLEVPGTYPKRMVFNIFGEERIKQFNIQLNEDVTVQFDIDAREYQGRWFNDIRAFNIVRGQVAPTVGTPVPGVAPAPGTTPFPPQQPVSQNAPFPPQEPATEGSTDDLPF